MFSVPSNFLKKKKTTKMQALEEAVAREKISVVKIEFTRSKQRTWKKEQRPCSVSNPGKHNLLYRSGRLQYFIYVCMFVCLFAKIIIVALHNAHIFRHKFILISINITHYCYCYMCAAGCMFLVLRMFMCVGDVQTCSIFEEEANEEKNSQSSSSSSKGCF